MSLQELKAHRMKEAKKLIEHNLPLEKWHFKQSAQFFDSNTHLTVIYTSEQCRIKVSYEASEMYHDDRMVLYYGCLEVSDSAKVLSVSAQEKEFRILWHNVRLPLYFLDGVSPQKATNTKDPRLIRNFETLALATEVTYEPEKVLLLHAAIWKSYGQRLFGIFDVHNRVLWERYSSFVRGFWKSLIQT